MALMKTVEIGASGVEATYWRILRGVFDFTDQPSFTVVLAGYVSHEARLAGRAPIEGALRSYTLTQADFAEGQDLTVMSVADLYNAVSHRAGPAHLVEHPDAPRQDDLAGAVAS